jgi:hypothetical protein
MSKDFHKFHQDIKAKHKQKIVYLPFAMKRKGGISPVQVRIMTSLSGVNVFVLEAIFLLQ